MNQTAEAWDQLKATLIESLSGLYSFNEEEGSTLYAINIHNDGERIKQSKYDRINSDIWRKLIDEDSLSDHELEQELDLYQQVQNNIFNDDVEEISSNEQVK